MTKQEECVGLYVRGWTEGNCAIILASTAENFVFGDPGERGSVSREDFPAYFEAFKNTVGQNGDVFMKIDGVVAYEINGLLIACCRWETTGKKIVGNGLVVVGPDGVLREDVAIFKDEDGE